MCGLIPIVRGCRDKHLVNQHEKQTPIPTAVRCLLGPYPVRAMWDSGTFSKQRVYVRLQLFVGLCDCLYVVNEQIGSWLNVYLPSASSSHNY